MWRKLKAYRLYDTGMISSRDDIARVSISKVAFPRQVHIPMIPKNAPRKNYDISVHKPFFPHAKPTMNNRDTGGADAYATIHHAPPITPIRTIVVRNPAPTLSPVVMSFGFKPTGLSSPPVPAEGSPALIPPLSAVTGPGT
jgi:hypothetical protein